MASSPSFAPINTFPNEILSHIFGYLDALPPSASISTLCDEPHFNITQDATAPLKAVSCVSKRWRLSVAPLLFKYSRFISGELNDRRTLTEQIQPFLNFVGVGHLNRVILSFTLIVHDRKTTNIPEGGYQPNSFCTFWSSLFAVIDPVILLIVAPAQALGRLSSCNVSLLDEWTFDCKCHYLKLERPIGKSNDARNNVVDATKFEANPLDGNASAVAQHADDITLRRLQELRAWDDLRADSSTLFEIRNWSKLLLNEGSFIQAYATYEWWLRQPPSILRDLLGASSRSHTPFITPSIRDFSYIGIFPMHPHIAALTTHLPRIDRLYLQLVPRNEIMQQSQTMKQVEADDLWMERNSCYAMLMRELFTPPLSENFKNLQVFESGDAADIDAWEMAVEYVKRAGDGWRIAGEGVFVRDSSQPEGVDGDAEDGLESTLLSVTHWNSDNHVDEAN